MVLSGKRKATNNLRWRFGKVYGYDTADRIFGVDPLNHTSQAVTKQYVASAS